MLMYNLKKTLNILYIFKTEFIKINYQSINVYWFLEIINYKSINVYLFIEIINYKSINLFYFIE
jgi:hypothetical protein